MAKKYSSLQNLAKGSGTPYGKSGPTSKTNNPTTFKAPYLKTTSPTYVERDGKSISNYVSTSALNASAGATCSPKHTMITSGEYVQGSFDIGTFLADNFRSSSKFPSAIYVNKYVTDGTGAIDNDYQTVTTVADMGGSYVDASGTTQPYTAVVALIPFITLLTGSDTSFISAGLEPFVLVYHARHLKPYAGIRNIRVTYSDTTTKDFEVIIPGYKNNVGLGQSLIQNPAIINASNISGVSVQSCLGVIPSETGTIVHSHSYSNINNGATPLFVGLGGGPSDHGLYNLNVTRLGTHHNNSGLWAEGFQPDDNLTGGSSFMTNAHQETWPVGLFYDLPANEQSMLIFNSGANSNLNLSIAQMWETQYNGSELTNITHPSSKRGNVLAGDSEQHYELIQGYLLNGAVNAANRDWNSQIESSQALYTSIMPPAGQVTNTADDGGGYFNMIQGEMMSAAGSVWNNSSLGYNTHQGGEFDGFIGSPGNIAATPIFQHIQIYSKDLACACNVVPPPGGPTPLDLCNDQNSPSYWGYTGQDCNGDAIPSDLWNGTATLGNFGCVTCDYELSGTSCSAQVPFCDCTTNQIPPLAITSTQSAPSILGGNDGVLDIEITGGSEGFVYFIEPLGNTSAGLGVGAVETFTQTANAGTLISNGLTTFKYTSGSASGADLTIEVAVTDYNTSPVFTLNKFITRGKDYVPGESLILTESVSGTTITITVGTVAGVVVSPFSLNNGVRHYETTNALCSVTAVASGRKVTIGTNVFLQQEQQTGVNNYGSYMTDPMPINLSFALPQTSPFKSPDFFRNFSFPNSAGNNTPITGLEAGNYKITVLERDRSCDNGTIQETLGCFAQKNVTIPPGVNNNNGCTDNNAGTFDGVGLNYDAAANTEDGSCIYCRAVDGKLVDNTSTNLTVSGSTNPGDILTSTNNSTLIAATDATTADGSISYSRSLNSIMNYYAGLITDGGGSPNAEFKMELYSCASSTQTLTGASLVGAPVVNTNIQGFNTDFDSISWSQGLTYGYYAIKSYVNDPQSVSEQEGCFQVDYFIVPVLACIIGQSGMQVGITIDNVTINDLDLVVASIPGNNLNPCTLQCCDAPTVTSYIIQTSPSCGTPAFNILQSCPNGIEQYITNTVHNIEFSSDGGTTWSVIFSNSVSNFLNHSYTINIYNAYGPGDYRVAATRTFTWANGTTSQCIDNSNSVSLTADICGCTDPTALNFDPLAVIDDGSCTYCVDGCMDPTSLNYNSLATCDDGSCLGCVYGCMDPSANNYNGFATCDDGSCNYGVGCGCTDVLASNFGYDCAGNAVGFPPTCDDGCCEYGGVFCANPPNITNLGTIKATCLPQCNVVIPYYGCTDPTATNYNINANTDDGSCIYPVYGCINNLACNYNPGATIDDGSCILPDGCTDASAQNYDPAAYCDDGSCIPFVYGCMDPTAYNYNSNATSDDGSCAYCVTYGCTNPAATNYNAAIDVNCDDGSCTFIGPCSGDTAVPAQLNAATGATNGDHRLEFILESAWPTNYSLLGSFTSDSLVPNYHLCTRTIFSIWGNGDISNVQPLLDKCPLLISLGIMFSSVTSIDTSGGNNPLLENFSFGGPIGIGGGYANPAPLSYLDLSGSPLVSYIYGYGVYNLSSVNTTGLTKLDYFWVTRQSGGSLITFDISTNDELRYVKLNNTVANSTLDFSNKTLLESLDVAYNNLTSLDLTDSPILTGLAVKGCKLLQSLKISPLCDLTTLNISGCGAGGPDFYSSTLVVNVGAGDVPGTTGGTGAGGLQTRVEYAIAKYVVLPGVPYGCAGNKFSLGTTIVI